MFILKKYNYFNTNQIKIKTIHLLSVTIIKKVQLNVNIVRMDSFSNYLIIESCSLLEFFSKQRASVNSFKQKYKSINIQLSIDLQIKNLFYFFNILKIFYLPGYKRQNVSFFLDQILFSKFIFSILNVNLIPFLPNTFFKWKLLLINIFFFNKNDLKEILLFLNYLGFYFLEEQDFYLYNLNNFIESINIKINDEFV